MQGLLARLRSAQAQNSNNDVQDRTSDGEALNPGHLSIHNLRKKTQSEDSDGRLVYKNDGLVVPELNLNDTQSVTDTDRQSQLNSSRTEDGLAIDIVMASNVKVSPKSRRSRASSPKQLMKSSRKIRGSRVSLNSISDGSVFADSDDESVTQSRQCANSAVQAWAAFENAVKNIDNANPEYFTKKPKPNFESSGAFQKVMLDMYGNTEYNNTKGYTLLKMKLNSMAKVTTLASRMMTNAVNRGKEQREREEMDGAESEEEAPAPEQQNSATKLFAKRGWKILKRQVQDTAMEQKCQSTKLNWAMLQHTVKQMSNVERTRQDLYERYGIVPTRLDDGTVVCENRMLSQKARAQLYSNGHDEKEQKRPSSYQPPLVHLRSKSQLSFQKKGRDGLIGAKHPSFGGRKLRPKTAK